jgi:hypothetical protein
MVSRKTRTTGECIIFNGCDGWVKTYFTRATGRGRIGLIDTIISDSMDRGREQEGEECKDKNHGRKHFVAIVSWLRAEYLQESTLDFQSRLS